MTAVPARGTRVRLRPSRRADIVDIALAGQIAEVEGVEHGADGRIYVVVSLLGDTAIDLGPMRQLGHRFFFAPDELEPLSSGCGRRILVAGVGDTFCADDGAASRVVDALRGQELLPGVRVADFGVRRQDLLRSLEDYDAAILLCTGPAGEVRPGRLADVLRTDPWALRLQQVAAHRCERITVVGCGDGEFTGSGDGERAVEVVLSVVDEIVDEAVNEVVDEVEDEIVGAEEGHVDEG
jgi:Ni,Fe-hydrogenase maturation factor